MIPPILPAPKGIQGIPVRRQQLKDPLTVPLDPYEMWQQAVQSQRGFLSSPSGKVDAMRKQPATVPVIKGPDGRVIWGDPKGAGVPVGKGYETFASIQIVNKHGERIALGADFFDGSGGTEGHAEARIIRALKKHAPATIEGGRLMLVVETDVCDSCRPKLIAYAETRGLSEIEVYQPERDNLVRKGTKVKSKHAARSSFQGGKRGPTTLRKVTIKLNSIPDPPATPIVPRRAVSVRTAIAGSAANLGAGMVLGIFNSDFKEYMRERIQKLPKPKIDKRSAAEFLSNPETGKTIRLFDLMHKKLDRFGEELANHHRDIIGAATVEIMLLTQAGLTADDRMKFVGTMEDQVEVYDRQLLTVRDNLVAASELKEKSLELAKGAEDVANLVGEAIVTDYLLKSGFAYEEIVDIVRWLDAYASRVRDVFRDVERLIRQIDRHMEEELELSAQLNKISWQIHAEKMNE